MGDFIAAAPLVGGMIGGYGNQKAYKQAAQSAAEARKMAEARYAEYMDMQQPYLAAGERATGQMQNLLGLNGMDAQAAAKSQFTTDPGWTASNEHAQRAMIAKAGSQGMGLSGNTLAALSRFNELDMANAYNQYYQRLAGQQQAGQNAVGQAGSYSAANTNTIAGAYGAEGTARGAATAAPYTGLASGLSGMANIYAYQQGRSGAYGGAGNGASYGGSIPSFVATAGL